MPRQFTPSGLTRELRAAGFPWINADGVLVAADGAFFDTTTAARWGGTTLQDRYNNQVADTSYWLASESPNFIHPSLTGHAREATYGVGQLRIAAGI